MSRLILAVGLALALLPAVAEAGCFSGGQVVVLQQPAIPPAQLQYVPQASCGQPTVLPATGGYGCTTGQALVLRERLVNGRVVQPVLVSPHRSRLRLLLGF
jgi:hypothetical protein